jgi:hypothetical protein
LFFSNWSEFVQMLGSKFNFNMIQAPKTSKLVKISPKTEKSRKFL